MAQSTEPRGAPVATGVAGLSAVIYGVGAMGRSIVPMLLEKGVRVVGAINRSSDIGRDVGELCGLDRPLGVNVSDRPEEVLAEVRADIAVLCVATYLDEMFEHIALCARHGIDVLTTAEELLFPWRTAPVTSAALERLALDHSVTVVGSGNQDYYWVNQVGRMAGTCHRIDRVVAASRYNVGDYGPVLATDHKVGLSVEDFEAALRDGTPRPSYMQVTADAVAADLDLRIASLQEHVLPTTSDEPLRCDALGVDVPPGTVTGTRWRVEVETFEGVSMLLELDGRLYDPGEVDLNRWTLEGEPTAVVDNPSPDTHAVTCATLVNRIPDVITAPPGLLSVSELPRLRYRPRALHTYLGR
jgi:2,4-diaminopentanoate dehydrogenase